MRKADIKTKSAHKGSWQVIDLFSGAGGMSFGFKAHPDFQIVGAADKQVAKPSNGPGTLDCNQTYFENIGIRPVECDLGEVDPFYLRNKLIGERFAPLVLCSCAPCTGFSRANPQNHLIDDPRNALVPRSALFVEAFEPDIFLMENARELIQGNYSGHYEELCDRLTSLGYTIYGDVYKLSDFGLPQKRERAIIIAVREGLPLYTLEDLWRGYTVREEATHVYQAIGHLRPITAGMSDPEDLMHVSPRLTPEVLRRIALTPHDGGSWADLADNPLAREVLTPSMQRKIRQQKLGSHPDVYGRMAWNSPAPTIKRECAHVGNGRYSHPEQDRLCTVREMAILQGFPDDYQFISGSLSNMYRHVGDAVPPLISYQIAHLCSWIFSGHKPEISSLPLPGTHLMAEDIVPDEEEMMTNHFAQLALGF